MWRNYVTELQVCMEFMCRIQCEKFRGSNINAVNCMYIYFITYSSAINTAIKCLPLTKGDGILVHSWTFCSIRNACVSAANISGAEVVTMELSTPIYSTQEVIEKYEKCLDNKRHIKVAVLGEFHLHSKIIPFWPLLVVLPWFDIVKYISWTNHIFYFLWFIWL